MSTVVICRTCGGRGVAELAANQQELASVGMLEQECFRCQRRTYWGLVEHYRLSGSGERRRVERRHAQMPVAVERRGAQRRARQRRGN